MTNPGEGGGSGDLAKIDNSDDQSTPQIDYLVMYSATPIVFDRMTLERIGADSDAKIWIGNVASEPSVITQSLLDSFYTEDLPDGGGPTRAVNFNGGELAGNLFVLAPKTSGVNDSFYLQNLTFTCPPTGPVNTAPDAVNDNASVNEDSGASVINVLANDSDADGDALSITAVTQPTSGAGVVVNNAGTNVSFTPATNFAGTTTFTYTISDGRGGSDTATVTVIVAQVNDAPMAFNNAYTVNEDEILTVPVPGVLGNDMDVENSPLAAILVTSPANGNITFNANGSFTYTPNAEFSGTDTFTYKANDGLADSNVATVTITVVAVNDAPVAVNDSYSTAEDTALNVAAPGVLANDTDTDGPNPITAVLAAGPAAGEGTLVLNADGSFAFTPAADFSGTTSFTYRAFDGAGSSNIATVTISVAGSNDAPVANDDSATVAEDSTSNVINVLANDTDADGDTLTVTAVGAASNGTASLVGGIVSYTPNANFFGSDSFTYTVSDGNGGTDTATVSITVTALNDAPAANDDSATVAEDSSNNIIDVLANDTDSDGDTLTISGATNGTNGTVVNNGTNLAYTPNANFFGSDSFTYTVSDGNGGSDTATVSITVTGVNDAPVAQNDSYTTDEDVALNVAAPGVLGNDSDTEGDALTVTVVSGPANGSLTLNADGSFSYVPNADYNGTDSFTYRANDGTADSNVATVTITVNPVQDGAGQLLINEVEIDPPSEVSDACQYIEIRGANAGGLVPAGTYFLSLNSDINAPGFANTVAGLGGRAVGSNGTITLINQNYAASCNRVLPAGTTQVNYSSALTIGKGSETYLLVQTSSPIFAGQDLDTNDDGQFDAGLGITVLDGFALQVNPEEEWVYGADAGVVNISNTTSLDQPDGVTRFLGDTTPFAAASFYYGEIEDTSNEAVRYIDPRSSNIPECAELTPGLENNVPASCGPPPTPTPTPTPTNNPPVALNDSATVAEDSVNNIINVLANDNTGGDGPSPLVITAATNGANGTVVNNGTNISYTPNAGFFGTDSFTYTVSDGIDTATATVNITVTAVNDAPVANDDSATVAEDSTSNVIDVLANDTDADGDTLTVSAVTQPANGTVVNNGTNVAYTPNANFFGNDSFTYTVSDGNGGSDTATVSITVTDVPDNTPPVAVDDSASVQQNSVDNVIDVLANDTDADGDTLIVTSFNQPANGTVTLVAGVVRYSPNTSYIGTDSFTYTISDGNGGTDSGNVSITVFQSAGQLLINEIEMDPPNATIDSCQYVEIRGQNPGGVIPAGTFFVSLNSDINNFGFGSLIRDLGGLTLGANGTLTLVNTFSGACSGRTYDAGTNLVTYSSPLWLGGGANAPGSETYLIIQSTANLFTGLDLDVDDDGFFDANRGVTAVLDGFALLVNPEEEYVYGAEVGVVNISNTTSVDQPDAVTRFAGNSVPFDINAFFFGEIATTPDSAVQYIAPQSSNFPSGGVLTPGGTNLP